MCEVCEGYVRFEWESVWDTLPMGMWMGRGREYRCKEGPTFQFKGISNFMWEGGRIPHMGKIKSGFKRVGKG
jgi:hypothetical protein